MQLDTYLREKTITAEEFGRMVNASPGAVRKWRSGERMPRPEHLARIREATGGAVTANDFVPSCEAAA